MKFEKINIQEIQEYVNNAKLHDEPQLNEIAESVMEFGYNDPIAIDDKNEIIEGHGRTLVLNELKDNLPIEEIKQIEGLADYPKVDIIRLGHMNESQKKKYRIAHNKINTNTGFDFKKLKDEFEALGNSFEGTGFTREEFMQNSKLDEIKEKTLMENREEVITVLPPEAPRLKDRLEFRCDTKADYDTIRQFFGGENKVNATKLLELMA